MIYRLKVEQNQNCLGCFSDLCSGDIFQLGDGFYMKISSTPEDGWNCVCLNSGELRLAGVDEYVTPRKCVLDVRE